MALDIGVADDALKYLIVSGGALAVLVWFFSFSRNRIADDSTRASTIADLRRERDEAYERMKLERDRADKFAAERNDALADLKAQLTSVEHLTEQLRNQAEEIEQLQATVAEQNRLMLQAQEEARQLRHYIHDVLAEINRFTKRNPAAAADLELPEFPQRV